MPSRFAHLSGACDTVGALQPTSSTHFAHLYRHASIQNRVARAIASPGLDCTGKLLHLEGTSSRQAWPHECLVIFQLTWDSPALFDSSSRQQDPLWGPSLVFPRPDMYQEAPVSGALFAYTLQNGSWAKRPQKFTSEGWCRAALFFLISFESVTLGNVCDLGRSPYSIFVDSGPTAVDSVQVRLHPNFSICGQVIIR